MNKKSKPIGSLYPDPSHKQGLTKTQNKGLVEDSLFKRREKKTKNKNKKPGVVTYISDKIGFNINKDQKKQRKTLHNDKSIDATTGVNDCKYICTQYKNNQIHKTSS